MKVIIYFGVNILFPESVVNIRDNFGGLGCNEPLGGVDGGAGVCVSSTAPGAVGSNESLPAHTITKQSNVIDSKCQFQICQKRQNQKNVVKFCRKKSIIIMDSKTFNYV